MAGATSDRKKGLYEKWLVTFTSNIMIQSFHAFLLVFIMLMLSYLQGTGDGTTQATALRANDGVMAVMSIAGMMAIIKLEKLLKGLFGIGDSISGDLRTAGNQLFTGMQAGRQVGGQLYQPFRTSNESKRRMTKLGNDKDLKDRGLTRIGEYIKATAPSGTGGGPTGGGSDPGGGPTGGNSAPIDRQMPEKTKELYEKMKKAKIRGDITGDYSEYNQYKEHAATQMKLDKATNKANQQQTARGTGGGNASPSIDEKVEKYNDSVSEHRKNSRNKWFNTATTLASMSMGLGTGGNAKDTIAMANEINKSMSTVTNKYVEHGENITANKSTGDQRYDGRTIAQSIKQGLKDYAVAKNATTEKGNINPVKITIEGAKSYATLPFKVTRDTIRPSKVDNVSDI